MRETAPGRKHRLTRRRWLELGVLSTVGAAGWAALRRMSDYAPPGRPLAGLSVLEYAVITHAARRITAADDPADGTIPTADEVDVVGFIDAWTLQAPADARRDLGRFLVFLEHVAPLAAGAATRFTRLPAERQDGVLASLESSGVGLLRAGFEGLRSLVFMGYYRDPRTWKILGYDGPLLKRPKAGWR